MNNLHSGPESNVDQRTVAGELKIKSHALSFVVLILHMIHFS